MFQQFRIYISGARAPQVATWECSVLGGRLCGYDTQTSCHKELFCAVTSRTQACNSPLVIRNDLAGAGQIHAIGFSSNSRLAAKAELITFSVVERPHVMKGAVC